MTDAAFWPTRRRAPRRQVLVFAALFVLALAVAGPRIIIDWRDLTCPEGQGVKPVSIAAVACSPNTATSTWPQSQPFRRYVGLFLTNVDVRIFDWDFGNVHGPGLVPID